MVVAGRYSLDQAGGNPVTFTSMLDGVVGMFEKQVDMVIPQDVAKYIGSAIGFNQVRMDSVDSALGRKMNRASTSDFDMHGTSFCKDKTHRGHGKPDYSQVKSYKVPLNDSDDWAPSSIPGKKTYKKSLENLPSIALNSSSQSSARQDGLGGAGFHESLSQSWQAEYSKFREMNQGIRDDVEKDIPQTLNQTLRPSEPSTVPSLLSSWSTEISTPVSPTEGKAHKDATTSPLASVKDKYITAENTVPDAVDQIAEQPSMLDSIVSWVTEQSAFKEQSRPTDTSNVEKCRESLMTELKSKLHGFLSHRKLPIESLIPSKNGRQEEETQSLFTEQRFPPPRYSLSHLRSASINPASQEDFMAEVKTWKNKYTLRKVPGENTLTGQKPRGVAISEDITKTESTILTYIPPTVPKTKIQDAFQEHKSESKRVIYVQQKVQKRPQRRLRKHSPQRKFTQKAGWKLGTLKSLFKRKKKEVASIELSNLPRHIADDDSSFWGSSSEEDKSFQTKDMAAVTEDPAPASLSLVEQRKAQLEQFLSSYAQTTQKETRVPPAPIQDFKDKPENEEGEMDVLVEKEISSRCNPDRGSKSQSDHSQKSTNSVRSMNRDSVCTPRSNAGSKARMSIELSGKSNNVDLSTADQGLPSHHETDGKENASLYDSKTNQNRQIKEQLTASTTSILSLSSALSVMDSATEYEEKSLMVSAEDDEANHATENEKSSVSTPRSQLSKARKQLLDEKSVAWEEESTSKQPAEVMVIKKAEKKSSSSKESHNSKSCKDSEYHGSGQSKMSNPSNFKSHNKLVATKAKRRPKWGDRKSNDVANHAKENEKSTVSTPRSQRSKARKQLQDEKSVPWEEESNSKQPAEVMVVKKAEKKSSSSMKSNHSKSRKDSDYHGSGQSKTSNPSNSKSHNNFVATEAKQRPNWGDRKPNDVASHSTENEKFTVSTPRSQRSKARKQLQVEKSLAREEESNSKQPAEVMVVKNAEKKSSSSMGSNNSKSGKDSEYHGSGQSKTSNPSKSKSHNNFVATKAKRRPIWGECPNGPSKGKASTYHASSLFGKNHKFSRAEETSESERLRKERKACLSTTLF